MPGGPIHHRAGRRLFGAAESGLLLVILLLGAALTAYGAWNPKHLNTALPLAPGDEAHAAGAALAPGQTADGRLEIRRDGRALRTLTGDRWRIEAAAGGEGRTLRGRIRVNRFFEWGNLVQLANTASFVAVIAVGMTGVIVLAGIDLSVGSIFALAGVLAARAVSGLPPEVAWWVGVPAALACAVAVGGVLGLANGAMVVALRIHPFVITLGTMSIYRGIAYLSTGGQTVGGVPASVQGWFKWSPGGGPSAGIVHPVNTAIMLVVALAGWLVLERTVFGRRVYAIGGNETAALYAGIPVARVKLWVYTLVGALAGLSACMSLGYYGAATSGAGAMLELRVIAAAVIGGASLTGGRGTALGAVLGAVIIELIANAISILSIENDYLQVVTGAAIILAVAVDRFKRGLHARAAGG